MNVNVFLREIWNNKAARSDLIVSAILAVLLYKYLVWPPIPGIGSAWQSVLQDVLSVITGIFSSGYILYRRIVNNNLSVCEAYLPMIKKISEAGVEVKPEDVDRAVSATIMAIKCPGIIQELIERIGRKCNEPDMFDNKRSSAVMAIVKSSIFGQNHLRAIESICASQDISEKTTEFIARLLCSKLDPAYADEIYLTWLLAAKDRVSNGVTAMIGNGSHPLWELNDLRNQGEVRKRVTDICLHLASIGKDYQFFATETTPPKQLRVFDEDNGFRRSLSEILNEVGVNKRMRVLIVSYSNLLLEVSNGSPSHEMMSYIEWHKQSSTKLRILVHAGHESPERILFPKNAQISLNFAMFGEGLVFAQHTLNKKVTILDMRKNHAAIATYKDFRDLMWQSMNSPYCCISTGSCLSNDIVDADKFMDLVQEIRSIPSIISANGSERNNQQIFQTWERCLFATPDDCPAAKLQMGE